MSLTIVLVSVGLPAVAGAAVFVPAGLNVGDQYQLAFLTQGSRNGGSAAIAEYNQFVQAQAALNPSLTGTDSGVTWTAILSTASVNAIVNAPVSAPVYLLNGTLISTAGPTLYSGTLLSNISVSQFGGSVADAFVWTGSTAAGVATAGALGTGSPTVGIQGAANSFWMQFTASSSGTLHPLYALSSTITVIPEPASLCVLAVGGLAMFKRKRR